MITMNDNELLLLAGIAVKNKGKVAPGDNWDPLNNETEATRLKELLDISLRIREEELIAPRYASACYIDNDGFSHWFHEPNPGTEGEIDALVRRVIVKAAADIGKNVAP